jgi:membrane-associated phospholipid phosphatase
MIKPHTFRKKEKNNSMPSGDAFQSAVYVTFLSTFGFNPLALLAFHSAVCIGRVYYLCHWIGDTLVSTCLGFLVAKILL